MRTGHNSVDRDGMLPPYECVPSHYVRLFTEYLRGAGYYCTNSSKTDYQLRPPFTAWDELSTGAHWRHRPDPEQPFFAVFNPVVTHESGMWPRDYTGTDPYTPGFSPQVTDPDAVKVPSYLPDTPKTRQAIARLYDNLAVADKFAGEILQQLEEDGLADNTIVVHWSDHGEGLPRHKRWPYDSGIRIPLIVRWPGHIQPGTVSDRLISLIDLGPAMLSAAGLPIPSYMQGKAFLGPQEAPPRETIFASRDRFDSSYDMIRVARDGRFRYMRNYYPATPRINWQAYRNQHPAMQELWRCHVEGTLTEAQQWFFRPRVAEELYDTENDPDELTNLAGDPRYAETMQRLRTALDEWMEQTGDKGLENEPEMVNRMWPGLKQPQTGRISFIPYTRDNTNFEPIETGEVSEQGPLLIQFYCATQGASWGYRLEGPGRLENERREWWALYTEPLRLAQPGTYTLRAKAIRPGYKESEETSIEIEVK